MKLLTLEDFAGCLNTTFTAAIVDGNVDFVLVEVRPLPPPKYEAMRAPFSLLFRNGAALLFHSKPTPCGTARWANSRFFWCPSHGSARAFCIKPFLTK